MLTTLSAGFTFYIRRRCRGRYHVLIQVAWLCCAMFHWRHAQVQMEAVQK